ncbi:MAG: 4Fe-4S binding protein [Proteobacteria bacterium]|nr:4Fe-4S binding protein [Desulfobulbaceae bacterium]MBU4154080.1 4Fe-4S binding protein [Pseudomonadota bacterium]MDP2105121.1 4Fe-4S binding protein [Desulfobulbaceae bacterium]
MTRRQLPLFRQAIQASFTIFCLYSGWKLYQFYQWAKGSSTIYVARPPSVEGFLPISGLVSLKRLALTGEYDPIHPAGLTLFLAALTLSLLLRKGFCGWICPVGFVSNLAETTGRRFKLGIKMPIWLDIPLLSLKYLLLGFFGYLILWKMNIQAIEGFMRSPYNMIVDIKMLYFFLAPSRLAGGIMLGLLILSFFLRNPWCRYFCPYGALLGLLALASPFQVKRDEATCIDCKKCERNCPAAIPLTNKTTMRSPECIGCLECVAVCPPKDCLDVKIIERQTPPYLLPALVMALFLGFWLTALITGHWHSQLPIEVIKKYYEMGVNISHPR